MSNEKDGFDKLTKYERSIYLEGPDKIDTCSLPMFANMISFNIFRYVMNAVFSLLLFSTCVAKCFKSKIGGGGFFK